MSPLRAGLWLALAAALAPMRAAAALGEDPGVGFAPAAGAFALSRAGHPVPIVTDPQDWPGVLRAARDLQSDIGKAAGSAPAVASLPAAGEVILVGTLGRNRLIDDLVRRGRIDAAGVSGQWEACLRTVVAAPAPGISRALVIAGSDKRGTIYGIYDLSQAIGVSPWYWWDDVPVPRHPDIFVDPARRVAGSPAVKYRGIFINDEAPALSGWAAAKFGGFNHEFYVHVFELLLRLRANTLWPAMWDSCFAEDDPLNPRLADEYGIVMGTSHVEPMMRADKEWNRAGFTAAQWNYATNAATLRAFWRVGVERSRRYENLITIGMRGKVDTPMAPTTDVPLLERIVADQRRIIGAALHRDPAAVPQVWALYKEVQDYYEQGMRVPPDVTLLWSDDNWGNLRRLPTPAERSRPGGAGVYYHLDYVGGPRSYKWLDTVPIPKIWEQMRLAWRYGADRFWIVNVGSLKGKELPMEFFLTDAWDPARWSAARLSEFTRDWAAREFGAEHAAEIARIVSATVKYNGRRKPEMLGPDTYSLTDYEEAGSVAADWRDLAVRAERINRELPAEARPAFYQLVLYPAEACSAVGRMWIAVGRNRRDAARGLAAAADEEADEARSLFGRDAALTRGFDELEGGRWLHVMDQPHIGYTSWRQPPENRMPALVTLPIPAGPYQRPAHLVREPASIPSPGASPPGPFLESGGVISIEAGHWSRAVAAGGVEWEVIPDFGRTLSGVDTVPVTAASGQPGGSGARLEYDLRITSPGPVRIELIAAPTLNFVPGRGLRCAVSLDDAPPRVVDFLADRSPQAWSRAVSDGVWQPSVPLGSPGPGGHVLKFWRIDPGVVLEKIVLDFGGERPSYLGPPESSRRGLKESP